MFVDELSGCGFEPVAVTYGSEVCNPQSFLLSPFLYLSDMIPVLEITNIHGAKLFPGVINISKDRS